MIVYLDSSAWVKLFIEESGSDLVRQMISNHASVCTHLITYAEMYATFAKARRMQRVTDSGLQTALNNFELEWQHSLIITVDEPLIRRAASLALAYQLRSYDSLHLAAAELMGKQPAMKLTFACFDNNLNSAATALGIETIDPG